MLIVLSSIRYAAPPLGTLRFAAPQAPKRNRTIASALLDPAICPQTGASSKTPSKYGFTSALGDEDCLFLNVYAPAGAKDLPVFFWIRKSLVLLHDLADVFKTAVAMAYLAPLVSTPRNS